MNRKSNVILPYESEYTGHREAEARRQEVRAWLREREIMTGGPSIVPETSDTKMPAARKPVPSR